MIKKKYSKKKGYLIWVTGISGSGKSSISNKLVKKISNALGPTILINGDDIRRIFNLKSYNYLERKKIALSYSKLGNFVTKQGFNVLFATVSMFDDVRKLNKKKIGNKYIEIYIKTPLDVVIKNKKKKIYFDKKKLLVGREIKAEFPKNPDIAIKNNYKKPIEKLVDEIFLKFKKILKI